MERSMVIIPGGALGPYQPLLYYSWLAGRARDAEVLHIEWPADRPSSTDPSDSAPFVVDHVAGVLATLPGPPPVLVGKSLATYAAELAATRALPAIWHTPLLSDPRCVAALRRASAPVLLTGGTADRWWDGALARELTPYVVEAPGADHGMLMPGAPLARSAALLGQVAAAVEEFLDRRVWPA